jgi:hypothetical protein
VAKKKIVIQFDVALQVGTLTQQNLTSAISTSGLDSKVKVHPLTLPKTREVYGVEVKYEDTDLDTAGEQQLMSVIISVTGIILPVVPVPEPLFVAAVVGAGERLTGLGSAVGMWFGKMVLRSTGRPGRLPTDIHNYAGMDGVGLEAMNEDILAGGSTRIAVGLADAFQVWTNANPPVFSSILTHGGDRSTMLNSGAPFTVLTLYAGCRHINDTVEGQLLVNNLSVFQSPFPTLPLTAPDTKIVFPANTLGIALPSGVLHLSHGQITIHRPAVFEAVGEENYGVAMLQCYVGDDLKLYLRSARSFNAAGESLSSLNPRSYESAVQAGAL